MDAMVSHFEVCSLTHYFERSRAVVLRSPLLLYPHNRAVTQKAEDCDCCCTALEAEMFLVEVIRHVTA